MTDQLTPVDKKVRLPLGMTLVLGLAVSACARIAIDTSTPVPIADNKPKPTDVVPVVDKKLGIQFEKVSVLNKRDLMVKNPSIASQVNALETEIKKRRPELFSATTQVDQIAISVPKLDMTGEEKTFIYPFITVKNTNAAESFVAIVLTSPDGKGVVAQSLTPQDIEINGKKMGALVLEIGSEKFPIFVFPMSIKEWAELSDSQKQSAMIDFVPPKENGVKIPLSGSKLASPALWDVNIGYASPSLTETPTVVPTVTPTLTPTVAPTWTPTPTYTQARPLPTAVVGPSATLKPDVQNGLPADWPAWIRQHPEYGWYKVDDNGGGHWATKDLPIDVCKDVVAPFRVIKDWPYDPKKPEFEKGKTYVSCGGNQNGFTVAFEYRIK